MTTAAIAWAIGRILNTYTFTIETPAAAAPFVSLNLMTAWGIPADAWAFATSRGLAGITMVDVRTGERFTLATTPGA